MTAIASLFVILILSILITRIASVALILTGVSEELARFQARSAFTGVGFTTTESESVVSHPVRRKIVMVLMVMGNAGIISALASLLLSLIQAAESGQTLLRLSVLLAGVLVLWWIASSDWIDKPLSRMIKWALRRWTRLEVFDYLSLLGLEDKYGIHQFTVEQDDWLDGKILSHCGLRDEGVLVLAIDRKKGDRIGVPRSDIRIHAGDHLILYGEESHLRELENRRRSPEGDSAHGEAVEKQKHREREQERREQRQGSGGGASDPASG